jgi:hypothetical protein
LSNSIDRRRLLRTATIGAAGAATLVGVGAVAYQASASDTASSDAAATATGYLSPAGTWLVEVTVSNGRHEQEMYVLGKDGTLIHIPSNGDLVGAGRWRSEPGHHFTVSFQEWLTDDANKVEGLLKVKVKGQVTAQNTFTGTGTVTGFDLAGHQIFQGTSTVKGTRFGIDDD